MGESIFWIDFLKPRSGAQGSMLVLMHHLAQLVDRLGLLVIWAFSPDRAYDEDVAQLSHRSSQERAAVVKTIASLYSWQKSNVHHVSRNGNGAENQNSTTPHRRFYQWVSSGEHFKWFIFKSTWFLNIWIIHYSLLIKMAHVLVPQTWSVNQRVCVG